MTLIDLSIDLTFRVALLCDLLVTVTWGAMVVFYHTAWLEELRGRNL